MCNCTKSPRNDLGEGDYLVSCCRAWWEEMSSTAIVTNIEAGVTEVMVFVVKTFVVVWYVVLRYVKLCKI